MFAIYYSYRFTQLGVLHMRKFSEILEHFEGQSVRTYIFHKIYGDQESTVSNFCPLCSENKVGFVVNDNEVFMYFDEIESYEFNGSVFKLNGMLRNFIMELI